MGIAVVFAFAADGSGPPLPGAAPLVVQARQIPRIIVAKLNGDGDRGVRFFPFLVSVDGQRQFHEPDAVFEPEKLRRIHGQDDVRLLVDGWLERDKITMRVIDAREAGSEFAVVEVPFEPTDPWPAVRRLVFELTCHLEIQMAMPDLPTWTGPVAGWLLIAKDEQLATDAQIPADDPIARTRAAREALALAPEDREIGAALVDICQSLVARGADSTAVSEVLVEAMADAELADVEVVVAAARLVEDAAGAAASIPLWVGVARRALDHPTAPIRAGFALYQVGRADEARELLRSALAAGNRAPQLRAQLAAAEEECGCADERDRILEDLLAEPEIPVPVARLLASWLVDRDRGDEAIQLIERVRADGVDEPGLWLEHGRARLKLGNCFGARQSLERCLAAEPSQEIGAEARRLIALCADEKLVPAIADLEQALRDGQIARAASRARRLVRQRPQLAEAWLLLGIVRQRKGQLRRATRAFRRAVALDVGLGDAHNRLGVMLAARGRDLEGYEHLRRATELVPYDGSPWLHLAQVCLRLGFRDEGLAALVRAERCGDHEAELAQVRRLFGEAG